MQMCSEFGDKQIKYTKKMVKYTQLLRQQMPYENAISQSCSEPMDRKRSMHACNDSVT